MSYITFFIVLLVAFSTMMFIKGRQDSNNEEEMLHDYIWPNANQADEIVGQDNRYSEDWIRLAKKHRAVILMKVGEDWSIAEDQTKRDTVIGDTVYFMLLD